MFTTVEARRSATAPVRASGRSGGAGTAAAAATLRCAGAGRHGPFSAAGAGDAADERAAGLLAAEARPGYDVGRGGAGDERGVTGAAGEAGVGAADDCSGTAGHRAREALARLPAWPGLMLADVAAHLGIDLDAHGLGSGDEEGAGQPADGVVSEMTSARRPKARPGLAARRR